MLAIGPMSKNCVEATIEVANEKRIPIMMIASRRQMGETVGWWICKQLGHKILVIL